MGPGSFPGVKNGRGVTTPHPLLVPWSRKGRAIPLLPLRAVRPVQSLSACTRVHFSLPFYITYIKFNSKFLLKVFYLLINVSTYFGLDCWLPGQNLRPKHVETLFNKQQNVVQQVGVIPRLPFHTLNSINSECENRWHCSPPENVQNRAVL